MHLQQKRLNSAKNPDDGTTTSAEVFVPQSSTFHGTQTTVSDEIKDTDHLKCINSHAGANANSSQQHSSTPSNMITANLMQENAPTPSIDLTVLPIGTASNAKDTTSLIALQSVKENSNNNLATDSNAFQQYLVQKQLNHLAKADRNDTVINSLQHCLFMHTDLDVLDKDNLFNCHKCAAKKQRT